MNYYERHLGDYAKDTLHLTMLEHGAYSLLLDRYYGTEQPIPADQVYRIALARTRDEKAAVDAVLREFFTLTDGMWRKGRCDEEITKAQGRIAAARNNGKGGGRPRKTKTQIEQNVNPNITQDKPNGLLSGSENETQPKALHLPSTIYQEGKTADAVPLPVKKYAFEGGIIKLTPKHFGDWTKAYAPIDLLAELTARDAWLGSDKATDADRRNWFISTTKYLANKCGEMRAKIAIAPKQSAGGWV